MLKNSNYHGEATLIISNSLFYFVKQSYSQRFISSVGFVLNRIILTFEAEL